jgi:hypothetical protein
VEARRIIMPAAALKNADIWAAMKVGGVGHSSLVDRGNYIEFLDNDSSDFPELRKVLRAMGHDYDFTRRRHEDGDNTVWYQSRSGCDEIIANNFALPSLK